MRPAVFNVGGDPNIASGIRMSRITDITLSKSYLAAYIEILRIKNHKYYLVTVHDDISI